MFGIWNWGFETLTNSTGRFAGQDARSLRNASALGIHRAGRHFGEGFVRVLPRCAAFNITFYDDRQNHFDASVGTLIDVPVAIYQRFRCISTGVKLTFILPCQLELIELGWEEGSARKGVLTLGQTNVLEIGQMAAQEELGLILRLRVLAPGGTGLVICAHTNESEADDGLEAQREITLNALGETVSLAVERSGAELLLSWPSCFADEWILKPSDLDADSGGRQSPGRPSSNGIITVTKSRPTTSPISSACAASLRISATIIYRFKVEPARRCVVQ
jgi:hypothetical protein